MKISALALEPLLAKMALSFNANLAAVWTTPYALPDSPFAIEFPATVYAGNTTTFFFGKLSPAIIAADGPSSLNCMGMYVEKADNHNFEKPNDFSGIVPVTMDFHLGWLSSDIGQNFETLSLAVEDAVAETIQAYTVQNWGNAVVYNGAFSALRSVIETPAEGPGALRQLLSIKLVFQIDI